jgi:hypothetical protein
MRRLVVAGAIVLGSSAFAGAQQVCPTETLKDPNMTLDEMYAKAEAKARAWKPDAVVLEITNTAVGTLQDSGKSATWNVTFYSPSAKQQVLINVLNAAFNCSAMKGRAEKLPDLKPGFFMDSAKLYAIAKEHGADYIGKGYQVHVELAVAPRNRHTTWNITYSLNDDNADVVVQVDANTGAFEQAIE